MGDLPGSSILDANCVNLAFVGKAGVKHEELAIGRPFGITGDIGIEVGQLTWIFAFGIGKPNLGGTAAIALERQEAAIGRESRLRLAGRLIN